MILDNENGKLKIHEWIANYTKEGTLSVVTGYFTIGALAYLSQLTKDKIKEYKFIFGDIVNSGSEKDRTLDLLNEEITIDASLKLTKVAREAVAFLELEKVTAKTLEPNFCHAKSYLYQDPTDDPQKNYYITGSSNLTEAGAGLKKTNNVELNIASFGSDPQYQELVNWFDNLWHRPQAHDYKTVKGEHGDLSKIPFKQYLIGEIKKIFIEYSPKQLYYKVLFELFGNDLLPEKDNSEFNRQIGRLENTAIYNALYEFQQKGVLSLIKMLQKYNGAILADAVGLGKTWSALAVIKFYELQHREVIVLCPKKLQNNWWVYKRDQNSRFEKDRFDFFLRFHTDLTDGLMEQYQDRADKLFINDSPKLFVIDESHNLRNDKSKRYQYLIEKILAKNDDVKILLLSATPINNSLMDIRNQFKLIVKGDPKGFEELLDIKNIDYTFRSAQKVFNEWTQLSNPKIGEFIQKIPSNFFKLTDALTLARTRKMIEGHQNGLEFPLKAKPENIFITPKQIGHFESFEELLKHFPPMLSAYQPSFYINESEEKDVLHDEKQRDFFLVKMMNILLAKRLESSWFSFQSTIEKILEHHQNILDKIIEYQRTKKESSLNTDQLPLFEDEELDKQMGDFTIGKKRKIRLADIERSNTMELFKKDLKADIESLQLLQSNLLQFEKKIRLETKKSNCYKSEDDKLETLIAKIIEKRKSGENNHNNKVIIFTGYKDTAVYLYEQLLARGFDNIATVSGDGSRVWDEEKETKKFLPILERFAPYTKLFREKEWPYKASQELPLSEQFESWKKWIEENDPQTFHKLKNPIDLLIATDALSEGQNLQDCDMIINYDVHWNPVRVIQRMGRIDRLGSPNAKIFGINFWPSNNINSYLNLQGRIEQRMAAMKLAGSEVHLNFSDSFKEIAEDELLEQKQNDRMMEHMQSSWEEIEINEQNLGFDNLSLEVFRQDLVHEIYNNKKLYGSIPNGVYTGFLADPLTAPKPGLIALLGYPCRPPKTLHFRYKGYELIYIDPSGEPVLLNQREVLEVLSKHRDHKRHVPPAIDNNDENVIRRLSNALSYWINHQAIEEEIQEDGTVKQKMGKVSLDILNKLKVGSAQVTELLQSEGSLNHKFSKNNFDLITWFAVSLS